MFIFQIRLLSCKHIDMIKSKLSCKITAFLPDLLKNNHSNCIIDFIFTSVCGIITSSLTLIPWSTASNTPRLRSRSKLPLVRPSQKIVTSGQTVPDRNDLWSDKYQTIVQTSSTPLSRLKRARNVVPDHNMHAWSLMIRTCSQHWQNHFSIHHSSLSG